MPFGLDGYVYEIDLNDAHASDVRGALGLFAASALRSGGRHRPVRRDRDREAPVKEQDAPSSPQPYGADPRAVRVWARANGVEVSARGRLAAAVLEQFLKAKRSGSGAGNDKPARGQGRMVDGARRRPTGAAWVRGPEGQGSSSVDTDRLRQPGTRQS